MNRNLHSPTKLTEFARDFDIEPDTLISKFVSKITNAYNSGYNTVNVIPTSSSVLNVTTLSNSSTSQNSFSTQSTDIQSFCSPSTSVSQQQSTTNNEIEDNLQDIDDPNDTGASNSVIDRIGGLVNRTPVRLLYAVLLLFIKFLF